MWAEATDKRVELMVDGNRNGGCKGNCHTAPTPCSPQSCVAYHNVLKKKSRSFSLPSSFEGCVIIARLNRPVNSLLLSVFL